jgi:hypothetical protein
MDETIGIKLGYLMFVVLMMFFMVDLSATLINNSFSELVKVEL